MRKLALGVILLGLTGTVAGATYDTVLYTDDPTADLRMYGEVWPSYEADSVDIILTYSLELENDAFNGTKVTGFDVLVRNTTGTVLRHEVDIAGLDIEDGSVEGYTDFKAPVPPDDVTELEFRMNHTAVLADGSTAERRLEGSIDPQLRPPNRTLDTFRTNATAVYRDQRIWVKGNASNILSLTVAGTTVDVDVSRFAGQVPVPDDIGTGRQDVTFMIESSAGDIFRRNVTLDIINRPPRLNLSVPREVSQGGEVRAGFDVIDDTGIARYEATLANATYTSNSSGIAIPTGDLNTGVYNITASVRDHDGAVVRDSVLFEVTGQQRGDGDGGETDGGEDGEGEENDRPSRLPLIGAFRDFVTTIIQSLLG